MDQDTTQPHQLIEQEEALKIKQILEQNYNQDKKQLNLYNCDDVWRKVLLVRDWSSLNSLWLHKCKIGDDGIEFLTQQNLPDLSQLSVIQNQITASGLKLLLKQQLPKKLKTLMLYGNKISNEGLSLLVQSDSLAQLQRVSVGGNDITAFGLTALLSDRFAKVKLLYLQCNRIGSTGVKLLIKSHLPILEYLRLDQCDLGYQGCKTVTKSNWPQLHAIWILGNNITNEGCLSLTNSSWPLLKYVQICWPADRLGWIAIMNLVAANWPEKCCVDYSIGLSGIRDKIYPAIENRFQEEEQ